MALLPEITVHGRFQPPLHVNHWAYVHEGFERAEHVTLLITNPFNNETFDAAASWRNDPVNNPFTFEERAYMFRKFFDKMSIGPERYTIKPFNIKDPASFKELDPAVPNLVNTYSEWSAKKVELFAVHGLPTIVLEQPKSQPVSGTHIREIIKNADGDYEGLGEKLVAEGFMPEAVDGLLHVLHNKKQ